MNGFRGPLLSLTLALEIILPSPADAQALPDGSRTLSGAYAYSLAIDGSGDIFYVGTDSTAPTYTPDGIYELIAVNGVVPPNPTVRTLASAGGAIVTPQGLALDSKGDVYVVDHSDNAIKELVAVNGSVPTNPTIRTLIAGVSLDDDSIAVDPNGNLYFDTLGTTGSDGEIGQLEQLQAVNGVIPDNPTPVTLYTVTVNNDTIGARVGTPITDAAGDVFFFDTGSFKELPATNGSISVGESAVSIALPSQTSQIAVAPNGTLYLEIVTDDPDGTTFTATLKSSAPQNGVYMTTNVVPLYSAANFNSAFEAVAMVADNAGNIFIANKGSAAQGILEVSPGTSSSTAPQAALTPVSYNFGSITMGTSSAAAMFTLANNGNAALGISSVALAGANANSFSLGSNTCGTTLAAGASCKVSVTFLPTVAGSATATLNVVDASGTQSATLAGSGMAATAPQAALSPSSADFGTVALGSTSSASSFTLTNGGNAALALSSVAVSGANAADFNISSNACGTMLAAGDSCTITVAFTPSLVGAESAQLAVVDSLGTQTSALSGTGGTAADFAITASPDSQTVSAGEMVSYTVMVNSASGTFTEAVALAATGLPPGATVTFSPAAVTPGSSGATSTMTVQTSVLGALAQSPAAPFAPMLAVLSCLPLCLRKRTHLRLRAVLGVIIIAATMQGCGGGFALPETSAQSQNYTIRVIGTSGTLQHSTEVQITLLKAAG